MIRASGFLACTLVLAACSGGADAPALPGEDPPEVETESETAPVLTSQPPTLALAGSPWSYVVGVDSTPRASLTVAPLPSWMSFDGDRTLWGTPSEDDAGIGAPMTVRAFNGVGEAAEQTFAVEVNAPPRLELDVTVATVEVPLAIEIGVRGHPTPTLIAKLPDWLAIEGTTLVGTPQLTDVGTFGGVLRATNGIGAEALVVLSSKVELPDDPGALGADLLADFGRPIEPVPYLYRLGIHVGGHAGGGQEFVFDEHDVGHLRYGIGWAIRDAASLDEAMDRLREIDYPSIFAWQIAAGAEVTVNLDRMPRYLSSCPGADDPLPLDGSWFGYNTCPPDDLDGWRALWREIVLHMNVESGLDLHYEVWNEPDAFFYNGTRPEFFELYRWAARGAREADPGARFGGMALQNFASEMSALPATDGWVAELIDYCATTPIPELGLSRTPIDFLSWHRFGTTPAWGGWEVSTARRLLDASGFPRDTELILDEWNATIEQLGIPTAPPPNDSAYNAAFAVSKLIAHRANGLDRHSFSALGDWHPIQPVFHGGQGLFTATGIKKAVYNGFRVLGMLDGQLVRVAHGNPSPLLYADASRSADGAVLVIAHSIPTVEEAIDSAMRDVAYRAENLHALHQLDTIDDEQWDALLAGTLEPEELGFTAVATDALVAGVEAGVAVQHYAEEPLVLEVVVGDLDPSWSETVYRVDDEHSNAYGAYLAAIDAGASEDDALAAAAAGQELEAITTHASIDAKGLRRTVTLQGDTALAIVWE